mgnify:CR=1 FL=1
MLGQTQDIGDFRGVVSDGADRASAQTGPVGSGHTMKLLNNFISLGYGAIYAEALTQSLRRRGLPGYGNVPGQNT